MNSTTLICCLGVAYGVTIMYTLSRMLRINNQINVLRRDLNDLQPSIDEGHLRRLVYESLQESIDVLSESMDDTVSFSVKKNTRVNVNTNSFTETPSLSTFAGFPVAAAYKEVDILNTDESEGSVSKNESEESVIKNESEGSVSKDGNEGSVSKNESEESVSKNESEGSVSKDGNEESVSKDGKLSLCKDENKGTQVSKEIDVNSQESLAVYTPDNKATDPTTAATIDSVVNSKKKLRRSTRKKKFTNYKS